MKNPFKKVVAAGLSETLKEGTKLIDEIFTTKEEKLEAKKELFQMAVNDRESARKMFEKDSSLQKVFAIFFLLIWALMLYLMMKHFVFKQISLEEWQIAFINTIWGGVSMKLGTIIDFLFGGSAQSPKVE